MLTTSASVESTPLFAGYIDHMNAWRDKIDSGTESIEDFKKGHANPQVDISEVENYQLSYGHKYGAGLLAIQCYPAEMMTSAEMTRSVGIVWYALCRHHRLASNADL